MPSLSQDIYSWSNSETDVILKRLPFGFKNSANI